MVQSVTQALQVLPLPGGGSLEILQDLVGELVGSGRRRFLLAKLIHLVVDALQGIDLAADSLVVDHTAAPADNRKVLVLLLQQHLEDFDPLRQICA